MASSVPSAALAHATSIMSIIGQEHLAVQHNAAAAENALGSNAGGSGPLPGAEPEPEPSHAAAPSTLGVTQQAVPEEGGLGEEQYSCAPALNRRLSNGSIGLRTSVDRLTTAEQAGAGPSAPPQGPAHFLRRRRTGTLRSNSDTPALATAHLNAYPACSGQDSGSSSVDQGSYGSTGKPSGRKNKGNTEGSHEEADDQEVAQDNGPHPAADHPPTPTGSTQAAPKQTRTTRKRRGTPQPPNSTTGNAAAAAAASASQPAAKRGRGRATADVAAAAAAAATAPATVGASVGVSGAGRGHQGEGEGVNEDAESNLAGFKGQVVAREVGPSASVHLTPAVTQCNSQGPAAVSS